MEEPHQVAIFWDYENCSAPANLTGYELVKRIRELAHEIGSIKSFKAYMELLEQNSPRSIALRSELQSSGVSIIDCPHNGYKNVADQMMIVDMLAFAMDNPYPLRTTVLLISGDRDFCYAVSVLRLRMYSVTVMAPPNVHPSLRAQASSLYDWSSIVTGRESDSPYPQQTRSCHCSGHTSSMTPSSPSNIIPAPTSQTTSRFTSTFNHSDIPRERLNPLPSSHHTSVHVQSCTAAQPPVFPHGVSSCVRSGNSVRLPDSSQTLPGYSALSADMLGKLSSAMSPKSSFGNRSSRASNSAREVSDAPQPPFNSGLLPKPTAASHTSSASDTDSTFTPVPPPLAFERESWSARSAPSPIPLPHTSIPSHSRPRSADPSLFGSLMTSAAVPAVPQLAPAPAQREPEPGSLDRLGTSDASHSCPSDIVPNSASTVPPSLRAESPASSMNIDPTASKDGSTSGTVLSPPNLECLYQPRTLLSVAQQTSLPEPLQSPPIVSAVAPPTMVVLPAQVAPPAQVTPAQAAPSAQVAPLAQATTPAKAAPPSKVAVATPAPAPPAPAPPAPAPPAPSSPKVIPQSFLSLLQYLEKLRLIGTLRPLRSVVNDALVQADKQIYQRAGCKRWTDFAERAENLKLIKLGSGSGKAWIALHPDLYGRIELKSS